MAISAKEQAYSQGRGFKKVIDTKTQKKKAGAVIIEMTAPAFSKDYLIMLFVVFLIILCVLHDLFVGLFISFRRISDFVKKYRY